MITLRPDQQTDIETLRENFRRGIRRQLLVRPTGSGKTVMFSDMTRSTRAKGKRAWIIVHRQELMEQVCDTLAKFDVPFSRIASGVPMQDNLVQVASVFTLAKRMHLLEQPDIITTDEAHHCAGNNTWAKVIQWADQSYHLGVTATPERPDGKGLRDCFDVMVMGPEPLALIESGILSRYELFRPPSNLDLTGLRKNAGDWVKSQLEGRIEKSSLMGDAVEHYMQHCNGRRALGFYASIRHAEMGAESFKERGIPAASIDGTMTDKERRQLVKDLASGTLKYLTSCDLLSEGFDCPAVEAGFLLRPTDSLPVYLQQVGRTLRFLQGCDKKFIFDHAGNSVKHGLPDDPRSWSLDGFAAKKQKPSAVPISTCKSCFAVFRAGASVCPYCNTIIPIKDRQIEVKDGKLEKVDPELARAEAKEHRREQGRTKSYDELVALAKQRGYAHPQAWAWHVHKARARR